jgi:TRAP-type transport system periplasmic protein
MTVSRRKFLKSTGVAVAAPALLTTTGLTTIGLTTTGARAQDVVTLKLHHFLPAQSNAHKFWFLPWAEKVGKESGGKIKVEVYPSLQLGGRPPQLFDQVKDGVVDIVWTLAGNTPGRFPRLEVFELPFVSGASGEGSSQAVWDYYEANSKAELKEIQPLAVFCHGKGNIFTKDKVIKTPADLKDVKIRVPSRPINDSLQLIGASPQGIPIPALPEALAKGVVDGAVTPFEIVQALKLDELTNRISVFDGDRSLYTIVFLFAMNKAKYDGLPADLKKVIDNNSGAAMSRQCGKYFDEWDVIGKEVVLKAKMPMHVIAGDDLKSWKTATEPVIKAWVEARTKAGDNGADLLAQAQALITKYSKT